MLQKNKDLPIIITILLLLMLLFTAYFQISWALDLRQLEQDRLQQRLRKNIISMVDQIWEEFFLLPAISVTREQTEPGILSNTRASISFWKESTTYPELFKNIYLYDSENKQFAYNWQKDRFIREKSESIAQYLLYLPEHPTVPYDDKTVKIISLPQNDILLINYLTNQTEQPWYMICIIDYTVFVNQLIPKTAEHIFEESEFYHFQIRNTSTGAILFSSIKNPTNSQFKKISETSKNPFHRPDFSWPLIPGKQMEYHAPKKILTLESLSHSSLADNLFLRKRFKGFYLGSSLPPEIFEESIKITENTLTIKNTLSKDNLVLEVVHKSGSLFQASINTTMMNILTSFLVVIILGIGIVILLHNTYKAQTLAEKQQEFIATVTHELKTPLAVISSAGQNLAAGIIHNPDKIKQYGKMLEKESNRLKSNIDYFLLYSNINTNSRLNCQIHDLTKVIEAVVASSTPLIEALDFTLDMQLPDKPVLVQCDEIAFSSVIQNLVGNVLKHARDGKYLGVFLTIESAPLKIAGKKIKTEIDITNFAVVRVADKGRGIPKKEQSEIFEPFTRGEYASSQQIEGNGIGLNLVKRIVTLHKGYVFLENSSLQGSTFTITIPTTNS